MNKIIIEPRDGLCNRLRFLFSYIQKLYDTDMFDKTELIVYWPSNIECPYFYLNIMRDIPGVKFIKKLDLLDPDNK